MHLRLEVYMYIKLKTPECGTLRKGHNKEIVEKKKSSV